METSDVQHMACTIIRHIPFPLGVAVRGIVTCLNDEANSLFHGCAEKVFSRAITVSGETETLSLRHEQSQMCSIIKVVPLEADCALLIFQDPQEDDVVHDELTGLMSRQHVRLLFPSILRASHPPKKTAILFLDLDGFKEVNDSLGHDAGDEALREVARRLLKTLRSGDSCFRWGGDEFIVISPGFLEKVHTGLLARRIIRAIAEPFTIKGQTMTLGVSIGIAVYPDDGCECTQLLSKADAAMYVAKQQGGNMYHLASLME